MYGDIDSRVKESNWVNGGLDTTRHGELPDDAKTPKNTIVCGYWYQSIWPFGCMEINVEYYFYCSTICCSVPTWC